MVLGICGGVASLTRGYLMRTGKYEEFRSLVERDHNLAFSEGLKGENIRFIRPTAKLPSDGSSFTLCKGL